MELYYLNKNSQNTGEHEVHKRTCSFLPEERNRVYLGMFTNGKEAVKEAKNIGYSTADGCYHCSPEAHTR